MALTSPGVIKSTNEILVKLAPEITIVKQFAYDISDTVADYGDKVRVAMVTGGTAENFDASCANADYEHATGELSDVFVTLDSQPKSTIPITQMEKLELPNDSFWGKFAEAGKNSIGKAISTKIDGLFTAAACTGGKVTMASVTLANVARLRASCAGRIADTVLLLEPGYYADLLGLLSANIYGNQDAILNGYIEKLYGFKAVVCANDLPDGIKGALVPANGVAVAVRPVAIPDPAAYPEAGIVSDENGFSLSVLRHTAFATGKAFLNTTCLVGAALTQPALTKYIAAS
jgi:hypothetical protein